VRTVDDEIKVPDNDTVFYHPVGKHALKPGTTLPRTEPMKEMLRYKHMCRLREEPGITPAQAEYIAAFDEVMDEHDITARIYFPAAWKDFVARKAGWIRERQYRVDEFKKQSEFLLRIGLLQEEDIDEIEPMTIAQSRGVNESPPPVQPQTMSTRNGCKVCRKPVTLARAIHCTSKVWPTVTQSLVRLRLTVAAPRGP
jgi:hypothetical protein